MSQLSFIAHLLEVKDSNINFFKVEDLRTVRSGVIYRFKASMLALVISFLAAFTVVLHR